MRIIVSKVIWAVIIILVMGHFATLRHVWEIVWIGLSTCNIFYLQMRFLICTTPSEVNDFIIYAKMACICGDFYVVFISHSWHWGINLWWAVVMDVQSHDPLCQDFDSSLSHSSPPAPSPRKSPNLLLLPSSSPQTN